MSGPEDSVEDIFNYSPLLVPEYQRGYSWDETNIEDLTEDMQYLLDEHINSSENTKHYFGTVILEVGEEGKTKIVDGQQRLISISLLVHSILQTTQSEVIDLDWDRVKNQYIGDSSRPVIDTEQQGKEVFERLMYASVDPNHISGELPAENNLIDAKEELNEWVSGLPDQYDEQPGIVYTELLDIIENDLTVTIHKVDDPSEAGRIFETINDRGKDLTIADKIKSYLIYVADRVNEPDLGDNVFKTFGEVVREISIASNHDSEDNIDQFIREHWRLFTGDVLYDRQSQSEYTDIHRQVKKKQSYASLSREKEDLVKWVQIYLESLRDCVQSYCVLLAPHKSLEEYGHELEQRLRRLDFVIQDSNSVALFVAAHQKFGSGRRLLRILDLLEVFGFRAYEVCRANRNAHRTELRRIAHRLYWAGNRSRADAVSDEGREPYTDVQSAFQSTCYEIENAIGSFGPEQSFERNLKRADVINGDLNDDGWNGFRKNQSILYFLLAREQQISESSEPEFGLAELEQDKISLEHIWPRDPEMIEPGNVFEHRQLRDSLGNLGFLQSAQAEETEGQSYGNKHRRFYSSLDSPRIMQELPAPQEGWGPKQIRERRKDLVEFAKERWQVDTRAHVHVVNLDEDGVNDEQVRAAVRRSVRDGFSESHDQFPSEFNNIPRIEVESSEPDFQPSYQWTCPVCGRKSMKVEERDSEQGEPEIAFICECNNLLSRPVSSFHFADHE